MMSAAETIVLFPELIRRPIVIPLLSFPGYGKTTIEYRFCELMGWLGKRRSPPISEGFPPIALPTEDLKHFGRPVGKSSMDGRNKAFLQPAILNLEEIQRLKAEAGTFTASKTRGFTF